LIYNSVNSAELLIDLSTTTVFVSNTWTLVIIGPSVEFESNSLKFDANKYGGNSLW